jgi:serine/threonine protein kinase
MSSAIQSPRDVFPGYQLTDRLGSGGYAEVWRARAPGGIEKAVKIVYGHYDDQLAAQEMKALERIKDVRHPFVLSLERFEIVDGRLAILTELADMSLEQRAQHCRAQGLPGIPRDELLRYMADTAEALDFLAERHSLQHLDIKPANLLISGDHIKVADFGLVKELASRTQNSMVAGMTPTYSSPEMFDDSPSPHSDQYSLAIVYQEMLTGVLPFPGRTAAQLANQHLRAQPQLVALIETDRSVVARALAKNPIERFPTCRSFVKALIEAAVVSENRRSSIAKANEHVMTRHSVNSGTPITTMPRAANDALPPISPVNGAKSVQPTEARAHGTIETRAVQKSSQRVQLKEDIVDVAAPDVSSAVNTMPPTLYIAVGGIGIKILCRLRDLLVSPANASQNLGVEMLAIDTDREVLKDACSTNWNSPLTSTDTLHLPLKLPQAYREEGRTNLEWLSHRWLYNIPRSLETRGYRPLGRLALVDHIDKALHLIDQKLDRLKTIRPADASQPEPIEFRVVLFVGMGGGTGGGMAIDLANLVRFCVQTSGYRVQVQGVFVCTCLENTSASPLSAANTYALLTELQFVSMFGNQGTHSELSCLQQLESCNRPFDQVYCVKVKQHADESVEDGLSLIAKQILLATADGVRQMLRCCQQTPTPRELSGQEQLLLRTFASASLTTPKQNRIDQLARYLTHAIGRKWLEEVCPIEWRQIDRADDIDSSLQNPSCPSDSTEVSKVASASSKAQTDKWRHSFGEHSSTRFAYEVLSRIDRQSDLCDAYRTVLLSSKDPARFVELASQMLSSIRAYLAESPNSTDLLSAEDETIFKELSASSDRLLAKSIDEIEQTSADSSSEVVSMNHDILRECVTIVEDFFSRNSTCAAMDSNSKPEAFVQEALNRADIDLLQCGYDRRTLIVVPSKNKTSEAIDALNKARPTAVMAAANIDESVIFCEGSGIRPSSLARGFERVFPGVAEAASRLFTRIDINWSEATL